MLDATRTTLMAPDGSLHRFVQRIARHPTLQRSTLVRAFFESTEWVCLCLAVHMPYIDLFPST